MSSKPASPSTTGSTTPPARREPAKPTQTPTARRKPPPLTHHDIMRLMGPLTSRGHSLDLERTDRARRVLVFHPQEIEGSPSHPPLTASLRLELPAFGRPHRLTRTLTAQALPGATATMIVEGKELELMLGALELVPASRQIECREGVEISRSYRITLEENQAAPTLVEARALFDGLKLEFVGVERSVVYDIRLTATDGRAWSLPTDFFAVIGSSWRPLRPITRGSSDRQAGVRPPLREPQRTRALERHLDEAIAHCRHTFARTPAHFHQDHQGARWRVVGQRGLPLVVAIAGAAGAIGLALALPKTPLWHMVMSQLPIVLIVAVSVLKEVPRLEVPPLPGRLPTSAWTPVEPRTSES